MNKNLQIIVVDDDPPMNALLCKFLGEQGFKNISSFFSVEEMLPNIPRKKPAIIIQDFDLPGMSGLDAIRKVKPAYPNIEFVFLSGQRSIDIAIDAIKLGAFDYIVKDSFAKENVVIKIKNLLRIKQLEKKHSTFQRFLFIFSLAALAVWLVVAIIYLTGK